MMMMMMMMTKMILNDNDVDPGHYLEFLHGVIVSL